MIAVESKSYPLDEVRADIRRCQAEHRDVIDRFHVAWYQERFTWGFTFFENIPIMKCPMDLWTYQEIIWDCQPTLIVETGTARGGSALYFARQLDRRGHGTVLSIDVEPYPTLPTHPRLTFVTGSSLDTAVQTIVSRRAEDQRVMVVLDSDHGKDHVLAELEAYAPLVTPGQFLVVEDTNINGRPVDVDWCGGDGPGPAVDAWLPQHPEFERDILAERTLLTLFPGGWLRRAW